MAELTTSNNGTASADVGLRGRKRTRSGTRPTARFEVGERVQVTVDGRRVRGTVKKSFPSDLSYRYQVATDTRQLRTFEEWQLELADESADADPDARGGQADLATQLRDALQQVCDALTDARDSDSGEVYSEPFLQLPLREEYPEYYEIIKNPICYQIIQKRIKGNYYKSFDAFERDISLLCENAKTFNEEGSSIYEAAEAMWKLFESQKTALPDNVRAIVLKEMPEYVASLSVDGVEYRIGDCVYVDSEKISRHSVIMIERVWTDKKGKGLAAQFLDGLCFVWPEQTFHHSTQKFYEKEIFRSSARKIFNFTQVHGKCLVLPIKDYVRGTAVGFDPKDVFVCESRYQDQVRTFAKIKDWTRWHPEGVAPIFDLKLFDRPLVLKRDVPSVFAPSERPAESTTTDASANRSAPAGARLPGPVPTGAFGMRPPSLYPRMPITSAAASGRHPAMNTGYMGSNLMDMNCLWRSLVMKAASLTCCC